jgi:hypothetical protein
LSTRLATCVSSEEGWRRRVSGEVAAAAAAAVVEGRR